MTSGFSNSGWGLCASRISNCTRNPARSRSGRRNASISGPVVSVVYFRSLTGYFLPLFFATAFGGGGTVSAGAESRLNNICCAIPTTLPVNQYNTTPLESP